MKRWGQRSAKVIVQFGDEARVAEQRKMLDMTPQSHFSVEEMVMPGTETQKAGERAEL